MTSEQNTVTIPERKPIAVSRVTIHLTYQDTPLDIEFTELDTKSIERVIDAALARQGWKAPKPPVSGGFGGFQRKPQKPPIYDMDGDPCCPHHDVKLRKKDFGLCCPKKLEAGDEHANERGYCKYVWREKL